MNEENTHSLDPRVNRLFNHGDVPIVAKPELDQLSTFEVFLQVKEGMPFEHAGIVHAADPEMAFVFGKEQFSRRGNTCTGMFVIPTEGVVVSDVLEGNDSVYDHLQASDFGTGNKESYEIFHLKKRGKHHIHKGKVLALNPEEALSNAKELYFETPCPNVWVVKSSKIMFVSEDDKMIWNTLHEKKYRDAIAYKAADKLARFKAEQQTA